MEIGRNRNSLDNSASPRIINPMNIDPEYRCTVPIQIRFNDIDGQQHVNNAVYQTYYDLGRTQYFNDIFNTEYRTGGRSVVIASVNTDFLAPIFLHDHVQVETRVSRLGNKSLTMQQRIVCPDDGSIKSQCSTVFAGFDYDAQQTIVLPEDLRTAVIGFEPGEVEQQPAEG